MIESMTQWEEKTEIQAQEGGRTESREANLFKIRLKKQGK